MTDRIYCANEAAIRIIDGASDHVIGNLAVGNAWESVLYNPANGKLYATTDETPACRMGVFDGMNDSLLVMFTVPDDSRRLAVDATLNRVYGTYTSTPSVACVAGAGDSLLAAIRTGVKPYKVCYNPVEDRLYTANWDNCGSVSVVDAATNSLLTTIPVGGYPWDVECDSATDKVFVSLRTGHGVDSGVVVIDCRADTIEAVVPLWEDPTWLCDYNRQGMAYAPNHKMYCAQWRARSPSVAVIDARADTVLTTIPFTWGRPYRMALNQRYDKLYVADYDGNLLAVISCATDSLLRLVQVPYAGNGLSIHYNPAAEKLYAVAGGMYCCYVTIVRGRDDSVMKVIETPFVGLAGQSPMKPDVFMFGTEGVVVLDGEADSVLDYISVPGSMSALDITYDALRDKVYCSAESSVTIIDALTYRPVRTMTVGQYPGEMVWVPKHNRVFVANAKSSSISVIRDTSLAVSELHDAPVEPTLPTLVSRSVPLRCAAAADIFDVAGRRLEVLNPGPNDISHLAPGVYFLKEGGERSEEGGAGIRKVVVTR